LVTLGQITGISSWSQELSPRRKIRRGLFESDNTLSGQPLPGAPNLAARSEPNWLTAKADPADRPAPGEADGQAEPEAALPRHCARHPFKRLPSALAFKHSNPTQPSPRGLGHIAG
jgi:hypothetical protein